MRSLQYSYKVIYHWPSLTAMIPRAEATLYIEKASTLHLCRPSMNMTINAASKAAIMITYGLSLQSCSPGNGIAQELAHCDIYGEYDQLLKCLQVKYCNAMADGNGNGNGDSNDDNVQKAVPHQCHQVKIRLLLWFRILPGLLHRYLMLIYIWYK